jgi:hypothetical protein
LLIAFNQQFCEYKYWTHNSIINVKFKQIYFLLNKHNHICTSYFDFEYIGYI